MSVDKHPKNGDRTQADEVQYGAVIRAENDVQREVISHLRTALKSSLENNSVLAKELAHSTGELARALKSLVVYRERVAEDADRRLTQMNDTPSCAPFCRTHRWDYERGWIKIGAAESSIALAE
jgi:hypothetical protein